MESKPWESPPSTAPSYDEAMKHATVQPTQMLHQYPPQQVHQIIVPQPAVQTIQPMVQNFNIGGGLSATCHACRKPLHTRVGYVSTCTTHCTFLLCCLFLCWPLAPFVYCTKSCREPRMFCVHCGANV